MKTYKNKYRVHGTIRIYAKNRKKKNRSRGKTCQVSSVTSNEEKDPHAENDIAIERSMLVRKSDHFRQHPAADPGPSQDVPESHDLDVEDVADGNTKSNNQSKSGSTTLLQAASSLLNDPAA